MSAHSQENRQWESITAQSAIDLRNAIREGSLTSTEVVSAFLKSIEAKPELGAFICVTKERALAEAEAADALFAQTPEEERDLLPPLHGMPIAFKDLEDVQGVPTTLGSAAVEHRLAESDSPGVAVLRSAGAICLGKTQVPEFGLTDYSENRIAPPARNPLDPDRTPGGSSGGSAAAVAAQMLPFAPGSDGGGSIRIPALACGLIGLKPGFGVIPTDSLEGEFDDFGTPRLTVTGPIARTAEDAALLFDIMRGEDDEPAVRAVQRSASLKQLSIGVSIRSPFEEAYEISLPNEASLAFNRAQEMLRDLGHCLIEADFEYSGYPENFRKGWTAGLSLIDLDEEHEKELMPFTRDYRRKAIRRGHEINASAGTWLRQFAKSVRKQWGKYDVVLTPGLGMVAPQIGDFFRGEADDDYRLQCQFSPYTSMVNVSGLPAIGIPVMRTSTKNGRHNAWGVQIIGRDGSEEMLLQIAAQLGR